MSNLQTYYHFKLDLKKTRQTYIRLVVNPRHQTRQEHSVLSCKAWNFPGDYPNRECKHDIKASESNMFNPIFE